MKRIILFFFVSTFIFTNLSYSQFGQSDAHITGTGAGTGVTFIDPHTGNSRGVNALLIVGTVEGDATLFYCVDITRTISFPDDCHHDSAVSNPRIVYILNNYYPFNPNPAGMLSLNQEVAATQLAIWHYSDGVDLSTVTDATIRQRAQDIQADADANGGSTTTSVFNTILILNGFSNNDFYVRTLDQDGLPLQINGINLSINQGSLSTNSVNTDILGNSPDVEVLNTATGTITAQASASYPQGITYTCPGSQRLVLAKPVVVEVSKQADWGALPVELSAFTYKVTNRNVTLNWTTASEINNSGFNIERKSASGDEWTSVGNVAGNGTTTNINNYSFTDKNVLTGNYNYRLKQIDFNGHFEYHNLDLEIEVGTPTKFNLSQNYPNPFNPTTKIDFDIAVDGFVSLKIFNSSGKEIATLVNGYTTSGYHTVTFDATSISSGIYYYRLEANGFSKTMKMALLK